MEFEIKRSLDYTDSTILADCDVVCIHVNIRNISDDVSNMFQEVVDISWVDKLSAIDKSIYDATSKRTIADISAKIKAMDNSPLTSSVGEYLVSFSAQSALVSVCGHTRLPLAELLKEKKSGNPGFDFHTISRDQVLVFGEAKYSENGTPKDLAINQIHDFVTISKDIAELHSLKPLLSEEIQNKIIQGVKGYAAAFSLNMNNVNLAFKNSFKLDSLTSVISNSKEYYLIAIEIC